MANNAYTVGSVVRVTGTFKDINGTLADPSTVVFKYKNPVTLVTTTLTYLSDGALVKDSTGTYHVDVDTSTSAGDWWVRWQSTGAAQGAVEGMFRANPTRV